MNQNSTYLDEVELGLYAQILSQHGLGSNEEQKFCEERTASIAFSTGAAAMRELAKKEEARSPTSPSRAS